MREFDKLFATVASELLFLLWQSPRQRAEAVTEVADRLASDGVVEGDVERAIGTLEAEGYLESIPPGNLLRLSPKSRELLERAIYKADRTAEVLR